MKYLFERPKCGIPTPANADEVVGQQECSYITDGNTKWYRHFARQFGGFVEY